MSYTSEADTPVLILCPGKSLTGANIPLLTEIFDIVTVNKAIRIFRDCKPLSPKAAFMLDGPSAFETPDIDLLRNPEIVKVVPSNLVDSWRALMESVAPCHYTKSRLRVGIRKVEPENRVVKLIGPLVTPIMAYLYQVAIGYKLIGFLGCDCNHDSPGYFDDEIKNADPQEQRFKRYDVVFETMKQLVLSCSREYGVDTFVLAEEPEPEGIWMTRSRFREIMPVRQVSEFIEQGGNGK